MDDGRGRRGVTGRSRDCECYHALHTGGISAQGSGTDMNKEELWMGVM